MTVWPALASMTARPMRSPISTGSCSHASSHPRMSRSPHPSRMKSLMRSIADTGGRPSELPSK